MACGRGNFGLSKFLGHAVYNDWKLAIQLFQRVESFTAANLRVPSESLIQLLELANKIGSQHIVKMLLTLEPLDHNDLLRRALKHNLIEVVEILLENWANANEGYF